MSLQRLLASLSLTGLACLCLSLPSFAQVPVADSDASPTLAGAEDSEDKDYASELPRLPALSLEQVIESFDVAEGFELQLIASEPLVFDPVAFAFDAQLRLFVVEMRDYSEQETEHLGSIALLQDTDGNGRMDQRTTFVEGLSWPTAIWPWKDGVVVAEPPRVTWYRDTDGDGRSDKSEDWFNGFGRSNVQGLVNGFKWGIDGLLHGATSSSGAELESLLESGSETIPLGRRDFAIDPLSRTLVAEAGGGQHGLSFNRWGDKFVTSNSDHLQQIIDLEWWLTDHTTSVPLPSTRRSIAVDGPQAEVFRSSPVEPWRIVRTRLRISGVAPGVVEGGGRAAGYFTGATGTCIMDASAGFGDPEHDTAIVCDVGSNLVHRKRMRDEGLFWSGERIDQQSELLRSSDVWFRPVQLGDGPDGSLYIADMAREVIEHPKSLPPMIKKHLDLTSGRDRGRIWRLTPKNSSANTPANLSHQPGQLTSAELVANLTHPVAWQRRMASQLLVERQAGDVRTELEGMALNDASPEAQILAMHVLNRLNLFTVDIARQLVQAEHPRVLQQALRLINLNQLTVDLLPLADDQRPRVQLEVALAAASPTLTETAQRAVLAELLPRTETPLVQAIVASVAGSASWQIIERQSSALTPAMRSAWLRLLLPVWSKRLASDEQLRQWMFGRVLANDQEGRGWRMALASSATHTDVAGIRGRMTEEQQAELNRRLEIDLEAAIAAPTAGVSEFQVLRLVDNETQLIFAEQMLRPTQKESGQQAVLGLLAWHDQPAIADLVIDHIPSLTPALQIEALRGLASRSGTAMRLADALESGQVRLGQLPLELREQLRQTQDKALAKRFQQLLGQISGDRQAVIELYSAGLEAPGNDDDVAAGEAVFRQVCAQCHRLSELGNDVGPPLKQLADKSPQQLLETILDPNREIDPKYMSYNVLDVDDRVLTGIIQDESAGQIVLKSAGGEVHTLARDEISQLKSSGVSLMPVGLEASISVEQMRQLIRFLKAAQPQ